MMIVHELPNEGMRLHRSVGVYLGHVQIVYKVNHKLAAWRTESASRLLFQRLFQNLLYHLCLKKVEIYTGSDIISYNPSHTII